MLYSYQVLCMLYCMHQTYGISMYDIRRVMFHMLYCMRQSHGMGDRPTRCPPLDYRLAHALPQTLEISTLKIVHKKNTT